MWKGVVRERVVQIREPLRDVIDIAFSRKPITYQYILCASINGRESSQRR